MFLLWDFADSPVATLILILVCAGTAVATEVFAKRFEHRNAIPPAMLENGNCGVKVMAFKRMDFVSDRQS